MILFQSSKNYFVLSLLWLIVVFLLVIPFIPKDSSESNKTPIFMIVIFYLIAGMIIWLLVDTNYRINNNKLYYNSGPIRGTIEIENIRKIERWNNWYVTSTLKPALGTDGLIIYYNKFDDIYISPKGKEDFIVALRKINPNIEVV